MFARPNFGLQPMFFILSKLLAFLLKPLCWAVILLVASFFIKRRNWAHQCRVAAAAILVFFSNPLIINQVAMAWESPPRQLSELRDTAEYAIVLGGYSNLENQNTPGLVQFTMSGNRLTSTYQLYKMGLVRRFVLTGGSSALYGKKRGGEAAEVHEMLLKIGVPEADILIDNESRNTYENALFTKRLLEKSPPGTKCLLVTSAFHMPRAVRCFDKVEQKVESFPVDFFGKGFDWRPSQTIEPDNLAFIKWDALIKEWFGMAAYKFKGYI